MGFYGTAVLPRLVDATCGSRALDPLRRRVCAGLAGDVVEIGFGSGLNIPFYPAAVTRVTAVELSDLAWRLAGERLRAAAVPVRQAGLVTAAGFTITELDVFYQEGTRRSRGPTPSAWRWPPPPADAPH